MKILTQWLRGYLPGIPADDLHLAEDLTLRGIAVEGVHSLGNSEDGGQAHLFEMDITTNRVDAMNHYGIAREAAAIYNLPLPALDPTLPRRPAATPFLVRIEAPTLCGRFTAQVLRNVSIAPTTGQVADYFALLGQKLISNAVDASNFTLLGMGHPTHAFDLDKVEGGLIIRLAHPGERLKLLDGTERTLDPDDLVVADHRKALALAGVMGGWDSMITPATRNILVEAAWFDPAGIRRSARRHGLHTDASHRFERGADFNAAPLANALVAQLILQTGGHAEGDLIDLIIPEAAARTAHRPPITLSVDQVRRHLGTTFDPAGLTTPLVAQYLTALGCTLAPTGEGRFAVTLPSWRLDLEREIDLIEEIARVYGYNRFADTLPTPGIVLAYPLAAKEAAVRARLLALGYSEALSTTFASAADATRFAPFVSVAGHIPLENPLSEEATLLRPSLIPGMLAMLAHNLNRDVREVRLFEQGHVFTGTTSHVDEAASLSLGLTGGAAPRPPLNVAADAPFFELKGTIESLLSLFDLEATPIRFTPEAPGWLEPGRSATAWLGALPLATLGELAAPDAQHTTARKLRQPIWLAEIDLARLYRLPLRSPMARELSRFQAVERDFSFILPDAVTWETVADAVHHTAPPELQSLRPIELWRDRKKFPGVYSLLLRCVFQSPARTLTDAELTAWSAALIAALATLGGTLRSAEPA